MWQPSPPPKPPSEGAEYLLQMASYYQDLVEYYQEAAEQAQLRLTYVEALLAESTIAEADLSEERSAPPSSEDQQIPGEQEPLSVPASKEAEPESVESASAPTQTQTTPQESEPLSSEELAQPSAPEEKPIPTEDELEKLLEANRGKILHLDYLVMELAAPKSEDLEAVMAEVDERLRAGAAQGRWARVPDSPNCWTLDLKEIPERVKESSTEPKSRTKGGKPTSLPPSPKFTEYPSLPEAIQGCLKESYPAQCSVGEVFDWIYPKGLPKTKAEKTKKAINNALLNYRGRMGWERVGKGRYAWAGS